MIKKESIENLKNYLDIVDVISQFIQLKKSGANFKACCPFHGEETPSFVVSPAKQIYHCFGCGVGGDSIKFIMEYEKITYPEAIEKLASIYNFQLEYDSNNHVKQSVKILEDVNIFYKKLFYENKIAKDYILQRGISQFSIEKFEIGYAPDSFATVNFLKSNYYNLSEAKDLGVIDTGQNGLYARFIQRITFPIYSINGKMVGFGGRTITGHNAKYINSPQTKVFNKSRLLYGYHIAKPSIYRKKRIIVCEGYLDVIMLHQAGFDTAVATLGTALTIEHLPLIKRGEPKVIVAYDGDNAGLNAAFKASIMLSQNDFEGGIVIFKEGKDPADMVKESKMNELNDLFLNPKDFIVFCIDFIVAKYDITLPNQKQKALLEVTDYLKTLKEIYQDEYKRYIAQKLGIRETLIQINSNNIQRPTKVNLKKIDIQELSIIKSIIEEPKRLDFVLDSVNEEMFHTHKDLFLISIKNPNDQSLYKIIMNEKLINYNDVELKQELLVLLYKYYEAKLMRIQYDRTIEFEKKAGIIRKIKDNIYRIRKGELVSFNL